MLAGLSEAGFSDASHAGLQQRLALWANPANLDLFLRTHGQYGIETLLVAVWAIAFMMGLL